MGAGGGLVRMEEVKPQRSTLNFAPVEVNRRPVLGVRMLELVGGALATSIGLRWWSVRALSGPSPPWVLPPPKSPKITTFGSRSWRQWRQMRRRPRGACTGRRLYSWEGGQGPAAVQKRPQARPNKCPFAFKAKNL
jgi:hypothetical protein